MYSPRIYLYKITFEEVPYYYYGVHKEKYFNEEYWGSPKTNKFCWEIYTPKKQILQFFDFTDEGWFKANEIEKRLIKPFYNTDEWCLNENCGGIISLEVCRKSGTNAGKIYGLKNKQSRKGIFKYESDDEIKLEFCKKGGKKSKELNVGVHNLSLDERIKYGKRGGNKIKKLKLGIHGYTMGKKKQIAILGGNASYEKKLGIHGRSKEQIISDAKMGGQKAYELKLGVHGRSKEQMINDARKGGLAAAGKGAKTTNSQKWQCMETGYISTPAGLSIYQRKRNIDTKNRIKL